MSANPTPEILEINVIGQVCPACLLVVLKELNQRRPEINSGRLRLVISTDHRNATITVPESARKMGYQVDVIKVNKYYQIVVGQPK